jgi:hypothetical protein
VLDPVIFKEKTIMFFNNDFSKWASDDALESMQEMISKSVRYSDDVFDSMEPEGYTVSSYYRNSKTLNDLTSV